MASLEEQLRRSTEVPPHVHNQALSQLDASLLNPSMSSGTASAAAGSTPTAGSIGLPSTSASSSSSTTMLHVPPTASYSTYAAGSTSSSSALPTLPVESTLPPPFLTPNVPTAAASAGWGQFDFSLRPDAPMMSASAVAPDLIARGSSSSRPTPAGGSKSTDSGTHKGDSLEKQMEGMNLSPGFIYLDEMGMTYVAGLGCSHLRTLTDPPTSPFQENGKAQPPAFPCSNCSLRPNDIRQPRPPSASQATRSATRSRPIREPARPAGIHQAPLRAKSAGGVARAAVVSRRHPRRVLQPAR